MTDMTQAAKHFAISQFKILSSKIVFCLGSRTLNLICKASGLKEVLMSESVETRQFSFVNSVVGFYIYFQ